MGKSFLDVIHAVAVGDPGYGLGVAYRQQAINEIREMNPHRSRTALERLSDRAIAHIWIDEREEEYQADQRLREKRQSQTN